MITYEFDPLTIQISTQKAARQGVYEASAHLQAAAMARAPIREGGLRSSAVHTPTDGGAEVSFNTVYANVQHEGLNFNHPRGGEARYLTNAADAEKHVMRVIVENHIRGAL